jgi:hypothetical protein
MRVTISVDSHSHGDVTVEISEPEVFAADLNPIGDALDEAVRRVRRAYGLSTGTTVHIDGDVSPDLLDEIKRSIKIHGGAS